MTVWFKSYKQITTKLKNLRALYNVIVRGEEEGRGGGGGEEEGRRRGGEEGVCVCMGVWIHGDSIPTVCNTVLKSVHIHTH